ncbi:GntR family transcriptional regulator [Leucobacter sp. CSA1]|uniref:GntR family transcriptional regulator n=1 Tax=Leucobacter chromiisoli TaxID=2796471 RepID=A0A934UVU4_9MICO|nr:GntR family transcriptional regulator [Leucobacter chromiisoli]MBK0419583.1 GntR family transcriptional regulator [Leucobacter chromiisoli]
MCPEPEKPRDKTRRVYDFVMERIVEGEYRAGDSLNIGSIAEATGVSLIPTREALRRLESEGLVEFLYHRGVRVAQLEIADYRDIMQTQAVLEALAVSMSAPLLTAEELDAAREFNRRMDEAHLAGDFHGYNENSLAFHGVLSSRCPNRYLRDTLERGQLRVAAVRAAVVGYRGEIAPRLSGEHVELVDRIAAGAPASEIERLMRAHREGTLAQDTEGLQRERGRAPRREGAVPGEGADPERYRAS